MYRLTIIVAVDKKLAIGKDGKIPWRLSDDMKHFAQITTGHTVVMGRKTFFSIPAKFRPLPNRENVIMTHDRNFSISGCVVVHTVQEVLDMALAKEIFVIGGAEIYTLFLPFTNRIIMTCVDTEVDGADTFFPTLNGTWETQVLERHFADEKNHFSFSILEQTRR